MANIKVDHRALSNAAKEIEDYISKQKSLMRDVDSKLGALGKDWQGKDYEQVKREWAALTASGSDSEKKIKALENYAKSLKDAASKYKDAQSRALNRANRLCN